MQDWIPSSDGCIKFAEDTQFYVYSQPRRLEYFFLKKKNQTKAEVGIFLHNTSVLFQRTKS